jgi:hypothetical protein
MKRKAILIEASNVLGLHDLPGARVDIKNWVNYLKSDLGGAWIDEEIVPLSKPDSGTVETHLKSAGDCYCFVVFSGHGSDGSVVLNEHWKNSGYSTGLLKPKSNKGTLLIDSCRGVQRALENTLTKTAFANERGHAVALHARSGRDVVFAASTEAAEHWLLNRAGKPIPARKVFEDALAASSSGTVEMYSCSTGQAAEEDPNAGGYYTTLLLQSSDLWLLTASAGSTHSTKNAHDYAAAYLPPQQTPEYKPAWLAFPFGVK